MSVSVCVSVFPRAELHQIVVHVYTGVRDMAWFSCGVAICLRFYGSRHVA